MHQLHDTLTKAEAVAVTAWNDAGTAAALMERTPDPGEIKDRRRDRRRSA